MNLSRAHGLERIRLRRTGGASQPDEDRAQVEATVEQVLHLSEVTVGVLGEVEAVVGACQRGLQVAQDGVYGEKRRVLGARRAAAGNVRLVQDAGALDDGEAPQAIGDQGGRSGQRGRGEGP